MNIRFIIITTIASVFPLLSPGDRASQVPGYTQPIFFVSRGGIIITNTPEPEAEKTSSPPATIENLLARPAEEDLVIPDDAILVYVREKDGTLTLTAFDPND